MLIVYISYPLVMCQIQQRMGGYTHIAYIALPMIQISVITGRKSLLSLQAYTAVLERALTVAARRLTIIVVYYIKRCTCTYIMHTYRPIYSTQYKQLKPLDSRKKSRGSACCIIKHKGREVYIWGTVAWKKT